MNKRETLYYMMATLQRPTISLNDHGVSLVAYEKDIIEGLVKSIRDGLENSKK